MSIIEKFLKESENINQDLIKSPYLPQSKLYLKNLDLLYYSKNTNNIILISKSRVIKAFTHSNLTII